MAKKSLPAPELLRQLLRYEPDTGKFYWLARTPEFFSDSKKMVTASHRCALWNGRYAEKEAFTADNGLGYKSGFINGVAVKAHRAAWAFHYGEWPSLHLDHINGDRSDNRICNLRTVTPKENARNAAIRVDNTSGHQGVNWVKRDKRWHARIGDRSIGYFGTREEAIKARKVAEKKAGFHANHGRQPNPTTSSSYPGNAPTQTA